MDVLDRARELYEKKLEALYLALHSNPEIAFNEIQTASRLRQELTKAGYVVTTGIGETGVVGVMENGPGKTLMIRTDMDALRLEEKTSLAHSNKGFYVDELGKRHLLMHACGHDVHMTAFIGAAQMMAQKKSEWKGTLMMLAQPAEELVAGARAMLQDSKFRTLSKPDMALALHVYPEEPCGRIVYTKGTVCKAMDRFQILVKGVQGKTSSTSTARNPLVVLAHIVANLPQLVACPTSLGLSSLTSDGNEAAACLSFGYFKPEEFSGLIDEVRKVAKEVGKRFSLPCPPQVVIEEGKHVPGIFNDGQIIDKVLPEFEKVFGSGNICSTKPGSFAEDFALFGTELKIPIFFWGVGSLAPNFQGELPRVHTTSYLPYYKETIPIAAASLVVAAKALLK
jgi:hippurate hydrolase